MADFDILDEMRWRAFAALVPPPQIPLSEWIEAEVYPYQRAHCRRHRRPEIERVTLLKAARIGFSALLAAGIGNYCINDPSPILAVQQTQDDCRDFVVSDLEPMFKASTALGGIFGDDPGQDSGARPATPS